LIFAAYERILFGKGASHIASSKRARRHPQFIELAVNNEAVLMPAECCYINNLRHFEIISGPKNIDITNEIKLELKQAE
jgi:hypothetical protein